MAMARLAVSLPCNAAEDGQSTFWLGVIAFGKQADARQVPERQSHECVRQYAVKSVDRAGWRHPVVLSDTGRQHDQVKQGNKDKLLMLYAGPMNSNIPMKDRVGTAICIPPISPARLGSFPSAPAQRFVFSPCSVITFIRALYGCLCRGPRRDDIHTMNIDIAGISLFPVIYLRYLGLASTYQY